jgi:hypothetical protein
VLSGMRSLSVAALDELADGGEVVEELVAVGFVELEEVFFGEVHVGLETLSVAGDGGGAGEGFVGVGLVEGWEVFAVAECLFGVDERGDWLSKSGVNAGEEPVADGDVLICDIGSLKPMVQRSVSQVDHLLVVVFGTIGAVEQLPCIVEACGREIHVSVFCIGRHCCVMGC